MTFRKPFRFCRAPQAPVLRGRKRRSGLHICKENTGCRTTIAVQRTGCSAPPRKATAQLSISWERCTRKAWAVSLATTRRPRAIIGEAQFALGLSYEFGEGVSRNRSTAINWLNRAAAQGDGRAGWTAEWLRNPGTPKFQNEAQLGSYISRTVSAWYNSGARGSSAATGPCSRFPSAMDCFNAARANDEATQQ